MKSSSKIKHMKTRINIQSSSKQVNQQH